jgi:hypothetical protein
MIHRRFWTAGPPGSASHERTRLRWRGPSRWLQAQAAGLAALLLVHVMPLGLAHAHAERTHGLAVMLAFRYLHHRALAGDVQAEQAIAFWTTYADDVANAAASDPLGPIALGLEPEVVVSATESPASREEPGLSGPIASETADKEFPSGEGALLATLTAAVDDQNDIWGDAKSPFQFMIDKFDEEIGNIGITLLTAWSEDMFDGPGSSISCSGDAAGFWESLGCALLDLLLWLAQLGGAPLTLILAGLLTLQSDAIEEAVAEDVITGCESNLIVTTVIDDQFGDLPDPIKDALAADTAFWSSLGISVGSCGIVEEALEDMDEFRVYGSPATLADALFTIRARLADFVLACDRAGGTDLFDDDLETDLAECTDDPSLIAAHFRTMDPWALSAEGVERTSGATGFWPRWRNGHNFTTLTHFLDLLSPVDGTAIDFSDPSVDVTVMAGPHGLLHPWDGYSLGLGTRFQPAPAALGALHLDDGDAVDDDLLQAAADFDLFATTAAIGHLVLRRRVCPPGLAGLTTSDGLGESKCDAGGAVPGNYGDEHLVEEIFPPAEMGALDGFTRWVHGELSAELVDATTQTSFTYYDGFLSFLLLMEDAGGGFPASPPFTCASPIDCAGNQPRWAQWLTDLYAPGAALRDALRLRGLALAIHMVQDMTVPHHLAPTTAFGHSLYESWFSAWLFPQNKKVTFLEGVQADVAGGAYQKGGTATAMNRWLVDPDRPDGSGPKTTDELFAELGQLIDEDGNGSFGFWQDVDGAWDLLDGDIAALVGATCQDEFAVRALTRAVAFETARITAEEGKLAPIDGMSASERAAAGFWIMSAISVLESGAAGTDLEVPTWRGVGKRTLPLLVAATARLLLEAARAHDDPGTTCDDGEDPGPPLDGTRPASITAPSCEEWRRQQIRDCFEQPSGPACAQYAGLPGYDACAGPGGPYVDDGCGDAAIALAACACRAAGRAPIARGTRDAVRRCAGDHRRAERVRDLERSGEIDRRTARHLAGQLAPDRDGDGIPDASDACPAGAAGAGHWPDTALDVGVCWQRAARRGACRYGCPLPTGGAEPGGSR